MAYLNSEYPSLSHTFIEREIRSARAHGTEVATYSIRRPPPSGRIGTEHAAAADETEYVLDGFARVALDQVLGALTNPLGTLRCHVAAQRLSPAGFVARLRSAAYAMEAVRLARLLARRAIRHIHVHMANNGAAVSLLACRFDRRLTYSMTVHGPADFYDAYRLRLGTKVEQATFVSCISSFCRSQLMLWADRSAWSRLHIVRMGVDAELFRPLERSDDGTFRLVIVGRVAPIKGHFVLLEACRELGEQGIDWSLDIVGDGNLRGALEQAARELGVADRVVFSGAVPQDHLRDHLAQADVMALPSFGEGVPVVLMEAMATELPVVATRVGGIAELIDDGESGFLVNAGSTPELVARLEALARDPELRRRLGRAGRHAVESGFRLDEQGARMAGLFRRYVGPRDAR